MYSNKPVKNIIGIKKSRVLESGKTGSLMELSVGVAVIDFSYPVFPVIQK